MNVPEEAPIDAGLDAPPSANIDPPTGESQSWSRPYASSERRTERSFDIAARSLVQSEMAGESANFAAVLSEGVLHHHWGGLGQYATIRVGTEAAAHALER